MEWREEHDDLRAQLAGRDALLDRMYYYLSPALASHQYSMSEETMHDALSALHEWRQIKASAEPSAPVERDERAEFERAYQRAVDHGWSNVKHLARQLWNARADLERKP